MLYTYNNHFLGFSFVCININVYHERKLYGILYISIKYASLTSSVYGTYGFNHVQQAIGQFVW